MTNDELDALPVTSAAVINDALPAAAAQEEVRTPAATVQKRKGEITELLSNLVRNFVQPVSAALGGPAGKGLCRLEYQVQQSHPSPPPPRPHLSIPP